jgi:hypothetical protein
MIDVFGKQFRWKAGHEWLSDPEDGLRPETLYYLEFLYSILRRGNADSRRLAFRIAFDFLSRYATAKHPQYSAYTTARRLIVLLVLAGFAEKRDEQQRLLSFAASHARHVASHLEYHLSANHILKCAKGLLFAGLFLRHPDAALWRYRAVQVLRNEINRQILPDGGHYERTFTYHCAVMEDLLDIEAALSAVRRYERLRRLAESRIKGMAKFLVRCLHPDGNMPLFGDSAYGLAPSPSILIETVNNRFGTAISTPGEDVLEFTDSGYYGVRFGNGTFLIVNAGRMGAPDQPGHAHCDSLSFEFSLCGRRMIVDTGVGSYTPGRERNYVRSTAAHNVPQADAREQAVFWASHRFASLAHIRRITPSITGTPGSSWELSATASGFGSSGIQWSRHFVCQPEGFLATDRLNPEFRFITRMHFHPDFIANDKDGFRLGKKKIIINTSQTHALRRTSLWEHFFEDPVERACLEIPSDGSPVWARIRER